MLLRYAEVRQIENIKAYLLPCYRESSLNKKGCQTVGCLTGSGAASFILEVSQNLQSIMENLASQLFCLQCKQDALTRLISNHIVWEEDSRGGCTLDSEALRCFNASRRIRSMLLSCMRILKVWLKESRGA